MKGKSKQGIPNFHISVENFKSLVGPGFWEIQDLPPERARQIGDHFADIDTLAVYASGIVPRPDIPPFNVSTGGIDWVRIERNPRPEEPRLNVYHYVIGHPDAHGYPVYGPILGGSIAPHWSHLEDLEAYFRDAGSDESHQGS